MKIPIKNLKLNPRREQILINIINERLNYINEELGYIIAMNYTPDDLLLEEKEHLIEMIKEIEVEKWKKKIIH